MFIGKSEMFSSILRIALISTILSGQNICADSVNGNDGNTGTCSPLSPLRTLGATQTAAIAAGNGATIGLARGSSWRESLGLGALHDVTVQAYGSGNPPFVNARDVLTGFTKAGCCTNVYVSTATANTNPAMNGVLGSIYYRVWESGTEMPLLGGTAAVDAQVGSAYTDLSGASPVVYVNPTNGQNPATSGWIYELNTREYTINLASSAGNQINNTLIGIDASSALGNNGSMYLGPNATVRQSIAEWGGKHNGLVASGEVDDSAFYAVSPNVTDVSSAMFVAFYDNSNEPLGPNLPLTMKRTFFIGQVPWISGTGNTSSLLNHVNGGEHSSISVEQMAIYNAKSSGDFVAQSPVTFQGLYLWNSVAVNRSGSAYTSTNMLARGAANQQSGWGSGTLTSFASYNGPYIFSGNGLILDHCGFNHAGVIAYDGSGGQANLTAHYNLFLLYAGFNSAHLDLSPNSTNYVGDHNVFYRNGAVNHILIRDQKDQTLYASLSSWQAASGQDAHSVYLTDTQFASFWLGNPANGDFRINPSAQVTGGDGTVYTGTFPDGVSLTSAGPQTHWDWNQRASVAGPPLLWPNIPTTIEQTRQYILSPTDWNFNLLSGTSSLQGGIMRGRSILR